jgi:microsomal dipeptidase-like Zn-dependent dipeptidase
MIPVFDGHNDALTSKTHAQLAGGRPDGDLDLPRMRAGGMRGGIFAVFTSSPGEDDHAMVFGSVDDAPGGVLSNRSPSRSPTRSRRPTRWRRRGGSSRSSGRGS